MKSEYKDLKTIHFDSNCIRIKINFFKETGT